MITKLALENIKSILNEQEIEVTPFTLLIGDNGSGKSTYIQMLSLLSQNPPSPSLADGKIVNQGGFVDLVNDPKKPIKIKLEGNLKLENTDFPYLHNMNYYFEFHFDRTNPNNFNSVMCKLEILNLEPEMKEKVGITDDQPFLHAVWGSSFGTTLKPSPRTFYFEETNEIKQPYLDWNPPFDFNASGWYKSPSIEQQRSLSFFVTELGNKLRMELWNITYVPALRGIDTRNQGLLDNVERHPINSYNFHNQSEILATSIAYNRDLEDKLSSLIESVLNRKCRARLQQGKNVNVEVHNGKKWVNIMNEGFGANPLVQLIFQIVAAPKNSLILIEEPEIHLFPAAQKLLIANLIKFAKSENKYLLITTHSAHIYSTISRFKENNDRYAKIYFFNRNDEGVSEVTEVTPTNKDGILKDFLSTGWEEIAEILESSGLG